MGPLSAIQPLVVGVLGHLQLEQHVFSSTAYVDFGRVPNAGDGGLPAEVVDVVDGLIVESCDDVALEQASSFGWTTLDDAANDGTLGLS